MGCLVEYGYDFEIVIVFLKKNEDLLSLIIVVIDGNLFIFEKMEEILVFKVFY